jgi:hypothetical protein
MGLLSVINDEILERAKLLNDATVTLYAKMRMTSEMGRT